MQHEIDAKCDTIKSRQGKTLNTMGKTPKKAAPGGDERNLYDRRLLKATTAASKTSETHLHNRQRESENPNRSKSSTAQKKIPTGHRDFTSKISKPSKLVSKRPVRQVVTPLGSLQEKKLPVKNKSKEIILKMQPESEEAEIKLDEASGNKSTKQEPFKETQNSTEKHGEHAASEPVQTSSKGEEQPNGESEKEQTEPGKKDEKTNNSAETKMVEEHEEREENEGNDIKLTFDNDESSVKPLEEKPNGDPKGNESDEPKGKENEEVRIETETNVQENDGVQSESLNDTENTTVETAESSRSELSEVVASTSSNDARKDKEKEELTTQKDEPSISYDPTILLKDVQIKLNDCMKENPKLQETTRMDQEDEEEQEREMPTRPYQNMSFGKTLRNISGRRSLSRMRHVTIREQRYSPNNSMFVNTSGSSFMPDETEDFKIVRYSTGVSETISASNGSSMEKKRKHEFNEDWSSKKQKIDTENSLLNTSISILKGLRRPIQASTPVAELKFQGDKLDLSDDERDKLANDQATKVRWCTVM
ncbi:uncharacterized protein LOC117221109 isoform X1 [Megalopta genalis]|uniref:uncharacterized protein LOC117221109 isoform X1 n=2 Tax=Megalopta genalis TaxID=115081 RepID=UPI003FD175B5